MKFCAACGAPLHGGRFCPACGAAITAPPAPVDASAGAPTTAGLPPLRAARQQRNWPALITGLIALAVLAGGVSFLALRDSGEEPAGSTGSEPVTTLPGDSLPGATLPGATLPASTVPATAPVLDPAAQLALRRDTDRPTVEALVGQWVPQLSAKREGVVADGITYTLADIVALHATLQAQFGAVLVWSGEYEFDNGDLWVSIAPKGFATAQQALDWCVAAARDRDNCLARLVTHDPSVSPTQQLQP